MAENESFEDMNFGDQGQAQFDDMMEDAVFSAVNSDDGAMMLGNMMTNGSEESMGMMMDTISMVGETDPNSTLALEVLSSMAENDSFEDMNFGDQGQAQFDDMMEDAVFSAVNSDDGASMLASVMTNSDADSVGSMLDYIADVAKNDPNSTFAAEVLSEIAITTANTDTYFDTETMNQFSDLVDTVAYTDTATDDAATLTTTTTTDDAAALASTNTTTTTTTTTDDTLYDAAGFAFAPPYYHKDTDTMYNDAGFDKDGNSSASGSGDSDVTYDAAGFSMNSPYYHKDTKTIYNEAGYDKYGNSSGSVAWTTTQTAFPLTLTKGTGITAISLSATGVGTISYSLNSGTFPSGIDLSGDTVSGNPNTVQAGTSVTIRATDDDNNFNDLAVNFPAVTAGGSFDANGFSTSSPFDHNVTGTQFDSDGLHRTTRTTRDDDGYNSAGYNVDGFDRADQWNASYDEIDDVSGA
jgi:hypothetical protein